MFLLPVPYDDELIYSTIARARVYYGIESHKVLLDNVFADRSIVPNVHFHSSLECISKIYPPILNLTETNLIYQHTLFPIFAPFISESKRLNALNLFKVKAKGKLHLMLGSASRVKLMKKLRYCPGCVDIQLKEQGENFWSKEWQVTGANVCIEHGELKDTLTINKSIPRQEYFPAIPKYLASKSQKPAKACEIIVTQQVLSLFKLHEQSSPTLAQWSLYYQKLKNNRGLNKGKFLDFEKLIHKINNFWGEKYLKELGLNVIDEQSCWAKNIFRKHRKSFSYLEHIIINGALLTESWCIQEVINQAKNLKVVKTNAATRSSDEKSNTEILIYRKKWATLVKKYGTKEARLNQGGGGFFMWLYRYDNNWLKKINKKNKRATPYINNRVDWKQRDSQLVKSLYKILYESESDLYTQKKTRNWYFKHFSMGSSIETNLNKLPLVTSFFKGYCESTKEFQIRRVTRAVINAANGGGKLQRWHILRSSGFDDNKIPEDVSKFLNWAIGNAKELIRFDLPPKIVDI